MIWVVAGEDEAGREAALYYYIHGFIATRYNAAVCCKRTAATRLSMIRELYGRSVIVLHLSHLCRGFI